MNALFRLESLAQRSRFRDRPVGEKLLFSMGGLLLALLMPPFSFAPPLIFIMALYLLFSGLALRELLGLMMIPAVFLVLTILPLMVEWDLSGDGGIRFSPAGFQSAAEAVLRSMGALMSVFSLTATTPLTRLFPLLHKIGVPDTLMEMTYFTYRMIQLFMDAMLSMARSQRARGGERSFRRRFRSRVLLAQRLSDRVRERVLRMERGLFSRGYAGHLGFVPPPTARSTPAGYLRTLVHLGVPVVVSVFVTLR